jgi:hypothetical protein
LKNKIKRGGGGEEERKKRREDRTRCDLVAPRFFPLSDHGRDLAVAERAGERLPSDAAAPTVARPPLALLQW